MTAWSARVSRAIPSATRSLLRTRDLCGRSERYRHVARGPHARLEWHKLEPLYCKGAIAGTCSYLNGADSNTTTQVLHPVGTSTITVVARIASNVQPSAPAAYHGSR